MFPVRELWLDEQDKHKTWITIDDVGSLIVFSLDSSTFDISFCDGKAHVRLSRQLTSVDARAVAGVLNAAADELDKA